VRAAAEAEGTSGLEIFQAEIVDGEKEGDSQIGIPFTRKILLNYNLGNLINDEEAGYAQFIRRIF
jgi:hypothetical protein